MGGHIFTQFIGQLNVLKNGVLSKDKFLKTDFIVNEYLISSSLIETIM